MDISGVSSNNNSYQANLLNTQYAVQQNSPFAQMLQNNLNAGQSQTQQTDSQISGIIGQDFEHLASTLQTGDLSCAQQSDAQLTQNMQSTDQAQGHHHHHHHHHRTAGTSQTDATSNHIVGSADASGSTSSGNGQTSLLS